MKWFLEQKKILLRLFHMDSEEDMDLIGEEISSNTEGNRSNTTVSTNPTQSADQFSNGLQSNQVQSDKQTTKQDIFWWSTLSVLLGAMLAGIIYWFLTKKKKEAGKNTKENKEEELKKNLD